MADSAFGFKAEKISEAGKDLVGIVRRHLPKPIHVQAPGLTLESWEVVGPSMVAKAAGTLRAMLALLPDRRSADATILLRSLYEGTLAMAWIAIDPSTHLPRWAKKTAVLALKADSDWAEVGIENLSKADRHHFEKKKADQALDEAPKAALMASEVDQHWGHAYPGIAKLTGDPANVVSFRGLYRHVFRRGSGVAHNDLLALRPFYAIDPLGGAFVCEERHGPRDLYPWLFGTYVLGLGLLIGSMSFGWPPHEEVLAALAKASVIKKD